MSSASSRFRSWPERRAARRSAQRDLLGRVEHLQALLTARDKVIAHFAHNNGDVDIAVAGYAHVVPADDCGDVCEPFVAMLPRKLHAKASVILRSWQQHMYDNAALQSIGYLGPHSAASANALALQAGLKPNDDYRHHRSDIRARNVAIHGGHPSSLCKRIQCSPPPPPPWAGEVPLSCSEMCVIDSMQYIGLCEVFMAWRRQVGRSVVAPCNDALVVELPGATAASTMAAFKTVAISFWWRQATLMGFVDGEQASCQTYLSVNPFAENQLVWMPEQVQPGPLATVYPHVHVCPPCPSDMFDNDIDFQSLMDVPIIDTQVAGVAPGAVYRAGDPCSSVASSNDCAPCAVDVESGCCDICQGAPGADHLEVCPFGCK